MAEGKEELDLEQQQCQEMESQWWCNNERIRASVSGWYRMWGNTGGWTITASDPQCSEMGSSPAVSTTDHMAVAVGTDPASSSEAEAGRG